MKLFYAVLLTLFVASAAVQAQTASVPLGPTRLAVVDTSAFGDAKAGISRIIKAQNTLETEFKPRRDELIVLKTKYDNIVKAPAGQLDQKALAARAEEAEALQRDMKRKQEDAQAAYARRSQALIEPISAAVGIALEAYAKQQKIDIVLDAAKFAGGMLVTNSAVDITQAFIKDYNSRNP